MACISSTNVNSRAHTSCTKQRTRTSFWIKVIIILLSTTTSASASASASHSASTMIRRRHLGNTAAAASASAASAAVVDNTNSIQTDQKQSQQQKQRLRQKQRQRLRHLGSSVSYERIHDNIDDHSPNHDSHGDDRKHRINGDGYGYTHANANANANVVVGVVLNEQTLTPEQQQQQQQQKQIPPKQTVAQQQTQQNTPKLGPRVYFDPADLDQDNKPQKSRLGGATARIVGGTDASPTTDTYYTLILRKSDKGIYHSAGCGASLISNCHILTAAHCVQDTANANTVSGVYVSAYQPYDGNPNVPYHFSAIAHVTPHELFAGSTNRHDVAIMRMKQCLDTSEFPPVRLARRGQDGRYFAQGDYKLDEGDLLHVLGFGKLREEDINNDNNNTDDTNNNQELVRTLQKVAVPYVPSTVCDSKYKTQGLNVYPDMICAGFEFGGKDSCKGDSGGPLVKTVSGSSTAIQFGIVSWGVGCGRADLPGVYSSVAHHFEWIQNHVCSDADTDPTMEICSNSNNGDGGSDDDISIMLAPGGSDGEQTPSSSSSSSSTPAPTTASRPIPSTITPAPVTDSPTFHPTSSPTVYPTTSPTSRPVTIVSFYWTPSPITPTQTPTTSPTLTPTNEPSSSPSSKPSSSPSSKPSSSPSVSPTQFPTSKAPTDSPSRSPSEKPVQRIAFLETLAPTPPSPSPILATATPTTPPPITLVAEYYWILSPAAAPPSPSPTPAPTTGTNTSLGPSVNCVNNVGSFTVVASGGGYSHFSCADLAPGKQGHPYCWQTTPLSNMKGEDLCPASCKQECLYQQLYGQ